MAVGFFANDDDEHLNSSHVTAVVVQNSATQTPLQSPVNREFLVQAFCEALNRCCVGKSFPIFIKSYFFLYSDFSIFTQINNKTK